MIPRTAEAADAGAIASVHVASWQSAYRGLVSDEILDGMSVSQRARAWEMNLAGRESTTLVVEVADAIVGFSSHGPSRDPDRNPESDAELYALYALPSQWSRGLGFCLWSRVVSLAQAADFATLSLWVLEGNRRGRRFYERQGCLLEASARKVWRPDDAALPEVRYSTSLRSQA